MTHPVAASKAELPPASITIGIDVSKDHLDAARHPGGDTVRVANTRKGQTALLRWIGDIKAVARVVFEPTGPYHRTLEKRLAAVGIPQVKVNPRQARRFAEATGKLAKTDRVDALMLARYGALLDPVARPAACCSATRVIVCGISRRRSHPSMWQLTRSWRKVRICLDAGTCWPVFRDWEGSRLMRFWPTCPNSA
ncbi:hypothetical protein MSKU15_1985 [Komagataeibacter diospyri]|nr:hypothetical protein MSKU15_1985 [Komagataeibacter diospyri]